jgi:hypothetical protein
VSGFGVRRDRICDLLDRQVVGLSPSRSRPAYRARLTPRILGAAAVTHQAAKVIEWHFHLGGNAAGTAFCSPGAADYDSAALTN